MKGFRTFVAALVCLGLVQDSIAIFKSEQDVQDVQDAQPAPQPSRPSPVPSKPPQGGSQGDANSEIDLTDIESELAPQPSLSQNPDQPQSRPQSQNQNQNQNQNQTPNQNQSQDNSKPTQSVQAPPTKDTPVSTPSAAPAQAVGGDFKCRDSCQGLQSSSTSDMLKCYSECTGVHDSLFVPSIIQEPTDFATSSTPTQSSSSNGPTKSVSFQRNTAVIDKDADSGSLLLTPAFLSIFGAVALYLL